MKTTDSMRCAAKVWATCLAGLLVFVSGPALATADGPDRFRVVDVAPNSVLNMRASPDTGSAIVGTIPSGTDGLANFGCTNGLTLAEYEAATESERAAARKARWCKVGYERSIAWAAGWYLAEGGTADSFRGGAPLEALAGSEWQLRDFAGETVSAEAWIAFQSDGRAFGKGGCNQFNGSYSETGRSLSFGPIAATMMACPDVKMQVERDFFEALAATREAVATHLVLAIFDESGTLLATFTRRDWD